MGEGEIGRKGGGGDWVEGGKGRWVGKGRGGDWLKGGGGDG